jgi:hypothetical protein
MSKDDCYRLIPPEYDITRADGHVNQSIRSRKGWGVMNLVNRRGDNGPNELADVVVHSLRGTYFERFLAGGWWSEAGLRKLIEVAFFTSLEREEGRYPRCSLFWSMSPFAWFDLGGLRPEGALDVATLRKLAPICQTRNTAIRVALRDENLVLVGLTAMRFEGLDSHLGWPGFILGGRGEPNVQVHILGPGHIRTAWGSNEVELRAGQIRECTPFWALPAVRALATEFEASVGHEVIAKLHLSDEECKIFGGLRTCMQGDKVLELVLRPILDAGHGGAVLVIPSRNVPWLRTSLESRQEVTALDLTQRAAEHLAACVEFHYSRDVTQDITSRSQRWIETRGRLTVAARAIGELAAVDGCVVLDRTLSVVGFGTKIDVPRERAERSPIQFRNVQTGTRLPLDNRLEKFAGTPLPLDELEMLGGTRLRSALWFCKSHPNVVAFVVSQDQDMKVLWSEDEVAFAFAPIAMSTIPQFA